MQFNVDIGKIANKLDFEKEDVEMLLEVFYESSLENLNILEKAIKNIDLEDVIQASHSIKGSSSNLLLEEIASLAKEIELNAKDNNIAFDYVQKYLELSNMIKNLISE